MQVLPTWVYGKGLRPLQPPVLLPAARSAQRLNMKKVRLELIPDPDMYIFFEKDTIDGVSYISDRNSKAKNKYLKSYDPKYIIYLDANNLYDYAMSMFLPTSNFKRINPKEFDLNKYASNSSKGCVFEVDLEYPKDLRLYKLYNDYPFAPDKIEIKREMLPDYN